MIRVINIWLDDIRPEPLGYVRAYFAEEVQALLNNPDTIVDKLSLDYHLGDGMTGLELLKWIDEAGKWPKSKPSVHSDHPLGRLLMREFIDKHYPENDKKKQKNDLGL